MRLIDLTGQRFGRLLVVRRVTGKGWFCRCDCGIEKLVPSMVAQSCGCLKRESTIARFTTHNLTRSPEYNSWAAMKQRCYYQKHKDYHRYGGRGITVCPEWRSRDGFVAFFAHVGGRPSIKHTIDRIDSKGDYKPGNVRWANHYTQSWNQSNTIRVTLDDGRDVSMSEAARIYNASYCSVRRAVKHAWHPETPLGACKRLGSKIHLTTGPRKRS